MALTSTPLPVLPSTEHVTVFFIFVFLRVLEVQVWAVLVVFKAEFHKLIKLMQLTSTRRGELWWGGVSSLPLGVRSLSKGVCHCPSPPPKKNWFWISRKRLLVQTGCILYIKKCIKWLTDYCVPGNAVPRRSRWKRSVRQPVSTTRVVPATAVLSHLSDIQRHLTNCSMHCTRIYQMCTDRILKF